MLLNCSILKAVGFWVDETQMNENAEIISEIDTPKINAPGAQLNETRVQKYYELSWMNDVQRHAYLIKRSKNRSRKHQLDCLDLSYSADPLRDIKLFSDNTTLETVRQVDISGSLLKLDEVMAFATVLLKYKPAKMILLLSKSQPDYEKLISLFSQYPEISCCKRLDARNEHETPTLKPQEGRDWGFYPTLPYEKITMRK